MLNLEDFGEAVWVSVHQRGLAALDHELPV